MVARNAEADRLLIYRVQQRLRVLVFRRDRDFRVVKRPSFVKPLRRSAHAERQTRVGRGLFERFGKLLHAAGAKNDGRHADALENADGGADVRAVRQMPLVVRQRKLRNDCASADVAAFRR